MPYQSNDDLPEDVQDALPQHAQEIYREAFTAPGISTLIRMIEKRLPIR
jgi:cation transport regulator ChaB